MRRIINLNTPEIPCPNSHYFTSTKFCTGFKQNGLEFIELNNLNNIEQYNSEDNIFLISNHLTDINIIKFLSEKLENAYFILWHFNSLIVHKIINEIPFKKFISTGEYYRKPPNFSKPYLDVYNFNLNCKEWEPFVFSSSLHPDEIGGRQKNIIYDSCFIGYPYKTHIVDSLSNCFKHYSSGGYLSEDKRIEAYLSSRVCLGFHSDENVANSCVVERVFEGMSYGCAVISDNKSAEECTNGIVKFISSREDVVNYLEFYKNNPEAYIEIQKKGYEYLKIQGTYYHLAKNFLNKFKQLYN